MSPKSVALDINPLLVREDGRGAVAVAVDWLVELS